MIRRAFLIVFLVVLVGSGTLWLWFERDMASLRARLVDRSQVVELATGSLEYAELGSGPPVLIIHGSGGGFDQAIEMAGPLAAMGYRLIAPSRFGYLRSNLPANAGPALQADAFAQLLDRLGIDDVYVFGGSAGALSAMQFAIRYPGRCRGLVLDVPATYSPERKPNASAFEGPVGEQVVRILLNSDFLFWLTIKVAPDPMTRAILATEPAVVKAQPAEEQARIRDVLRHILPVSTRTDGLLLDMKTAGTPEPLPLQKIRCPVLSISARDDLYGTAASAEYAARTVPDGRAIIYESGGHLLAGHYADAWKEIATFYGGLVAPTPPATEPGGGPAHRDRSESN